MQQAVLRLFNSVQIDKVDNHIITQDITARTIRHGYLLEPGIQANHRLLETIDSVIGISGEKANSAFHKSWTIIEESSLESLVTQQILHYITTYDFEAMGIYDKDTVYIPHETLNIPNIKQDIPLTLIKALNKQSLLDEIINLASGIALSEQSLKDILSIIEANKYQPTFIKNIHNRELKTMLYDYYRLVPEDPVEYLRYIISKLTDESLLIKNKNLIEKIKASNGKYLDELLEKAPVDLASIFYRYKPIFLALKAVSRNKTFFNQLRKKAPALHQPLPEDFLNNVTCNLKQNSLQLDKLTQRVKKASIFRKIRLAYALKYRLNPNDSIVYRVRNGRGWATDFTWSHELNHQTEAALETVISSIVSDLKPKLEGTLIYIPEHINYALPATEKQFTGNFPTGSNIALPDDLVIGIHWMNTKRRIDLDLSMIGESGKLGWDGDYRSKNKDILFSGDMTDAPPPKGATELFYLKQGFQEAKILMLNYFNYSASDPVDAKIIVANEKPNRFKTNYMIDPNNIVATANIKISQKQSVLGLITPSKQGGRIYFSHVRVGTSISSSVNIHTTQARNYLIKSLIETIDFKSILKSAGATITKTKTGKEDFDLSPEALNKSSFINLLN